MFFVFQGLLKVAIDNARTQEKQVQMEKTELKMELFRERELRETLEKQLAVEQKNRGIWLWYIVHIRIVIMYVCLSISAYLDLGSMMLQYFIMNMVKK